MIHDAARPCITPADILKTVNALNHHRAATLAIPKSSTLRREQDNATAGETIDRSGLWTVQTPQAFRYGDVLSAHETAQNAAVVTDDTMLVSALGIEVGLVPGSAENIKITYPEDMAMAEKILYAAQTVVSGQGFDVHAFDPDRSGPVRLCGVDVPHTYALKGHSDADVGLHALTDALLGAIGGGDIGRHFPPSDPTFKAMDSAVFLQKAMSLLTKAGGKLNNLDITLICEAPKITPFAPAMVERLSALTGLPPGRINVKATTTEKLGFTGRGEGIAAQAIVSASLPGESA